MMPRRTPAQPRSQGKRERKPVVYIVCEGSETEIRYFRHFRSRNSLVEVRPFVSQHKSALGLVKHAQDVIKQEPFYPQDGDQLWCVFDRDNNSNQDLQKAESFANRHNYRIAFSNPCFELWFLLHFIDQKGYLDDADAVIRLLNSHKAIPDYKKSGDYYDLIYPMMKIASERANNLISLHTADEKRLISRESNPCTTAVRLLEYLSERRKANNT